MFKTIDAVNGGQHFWNTLQRLHQIPFDLGTCQCAASLGGVGTTVALVVAPDESDNDIGRRYIVELRSMLNDVVLMAASLDRGMRYIDGVTVGTNADEVEAAEVMAMFAHELDGVEWVRVGPEIEPEVEYAA